MIKIVHEDRRRVKRPLPAVIVGHIVQPEPGSIVPQLRIQPLPIGAVPSAINLLVQGQKLRMPFPNVVEDDRFVAAPQVEVFQPDPVALSLHPVDDGLSIGEAGEDGRDKAGGADPAALELFQQRAGAPERLFLGQIGVRNRADEELLPGIPLRVANLRPALDIQEGPPRVPGGW